MVSKVVSNSELVSNDGTFTIDNQTYYDFSDNITPSDPDKRYLINEDAETFILIGNQLQSGWQLSVDNQQYEITKVLNSYPYIVSCENHIIYFGDEINLSSIPTKIIPKTTLIDNQEYTINSVLGAGNFGVVYLLVNKQDPKNKLVLKLPLGNSEDLNQYIEDQFYARLGLARGKDSQGNQVIAFMDHCKTLYDEVFENENGNKADLGERIKIARNMLNAYKRFQDRFDDAGKPTHRDISPKNFLINEDTKECTLFDFGLSYQREIIAKTIEEKDAAEEAHSLLMGIKGGMRYMAPQMFDMKSTPDPRYDHYSLGVIVGEILGTRTDLYDETYNHQFFSPELRENLTPENVREAFKYQVRVNNTGDTVALLALNYNKDQEKSPIDYEMIELVQQMVRTISGTPNMMTPEVAIKKLEELQIKYLLYEALKADDKLDKYIAINDAVGRFIIDNKEVNDQFIENLKKLLSSPPCNEINDKTKNELVTLLAQKNTLIYDEKLLEAVYKQIPYHTDNTKKIDMARDDMPFSVVCNDKNQAFVVLAKPLSNGEYFAQNLTTKEWVKIQVAWEKNNNNGENLKISGENISILSGTAEEQLAVFSKIVEEKKKCEEALLSKKTEYNEETINLIAQLMSIVNENENKDNHNLKQKVCIVAGYFKSDSLTQFPEAYADLQEILRSSNNFNILNNSSSILKEFISASIEKELGNETIQTTSHNDRPIRMNEEYAQYLDTKEWYKVEDGKITDKLFVGKATFDNGKVAENIIKSFTNKQQLGLSVSSYGVSNSHTTEGSSSAPPTPPTPSTSSTLSTPSTPRARNDEEVASTASTKHKTTYRS
jgi:serine/threonine protein kinase